MYKFKINAGENYFVGFLSFTCIIAELTFHGQIFEYDAPT